jgi:hypothetical protein
MISSACPDNRTTMSKYVPPSRRPGYVPSTSTLPPGYRSPGTAGEGQYTLSDLAEHFNHPQDSTLTFFSHPVPPTSDTRLGYRDHLRDTIATEPQPSAMESTLEHPLRHLVSYGVIWNNAHPAWEKEGELWIHTNAEKFIDDYENEKKKNFGRPIPVFAQVRGRHKIVTFIGWWYILSRCYLLCD